MRAACAAATALLLTGLALTGGSEAAVVPIVEGEYTSLSSFCEMRVDGRALQGDGADDSIAGSRAGDLLRGGGGDDRLSGRGGGDCLQAQSGNDRVVGGGGGDVISGEAGDDQLRAGPGKDSVSCGRGDDTAVVDRRDDVARDCERVRIG